MNKWINVTVACKAAEADGVCTVEFVASAGGTLPRFDAGAHVDVDLGGGIVRPYSLCNDPAETDRYLVAVLREQASRGGSIAVHDVLIAGHTLRISEPRNHFELAETRGRSLLFAGGIGVTPLLAMADALHARDADFILHYCARSPDRMAFQKRLRSGRFAWRVQMHFDDGPAEQRLDPSRAVSGFAHDDHLYVCGPGGFIDWIVGHARTAGWSEAQIHREYFTPPISSDMPADGFDVRLAKSGKVFHVPSDKSIADVLIANGVDVAMSCEQGVCGTCVTHVLEGVPDHRDYFLTDAEHDANTQITVCISRSKSGLLVLDA